MYLICAKVLEANMQDTETRCSRGHHHSRQRDGIVTEAPGLQGRVTSELRLWGLFCEMFSPGVAAFPVRNPGRIQKPRAQSVSGVPNPWGSLVT